MIGYYVRLYNTQNPPDVVWDEVHFGNFTNGYIKGEYFFDIHPPFAKLQFAFWDWLQEYNGSIMFEGYDRGYKDENFISLRITPIMYSSLVPCMIYVAMRSALFSKIAAFTSGFLISIETSMIAEGKFLFTDGTLHFYTMFSMIFINLFLSKHTRTKEWWRWMKISSFFMGLAFSIKNTALSLIFLTAYTQIVEIIIFRNFDFDIDLYAEVCSRIWYSLWPGLLIHFAIWAYHFTVLPYGTEDVFDSDWESYSLIDRKRDNETAFIQFVHWPPLTLRVLDVISSTFISNGLNFEPHDSMSRPFDWPLLLDKWIMYYPRWQGDFVCCGNLFVYVMTFSGVILSMLGFWSKKQFPYALRFIVGYWVSYLPFYGVPRTMFLYHYHVPLMFASCCLGCALDLWLPKYWKGFACVFIIFAGLVGYFIINPFIYGNGRVNREWRLLNKSWRDGKPGRHKYYDYMASKASSQKKAYHENDPNYTDPTPESGRRGRGRARRRARS
ncbi:Dolichyl-phosphate-mannose-protein mannosyltransferase, putative [Trichomonas vaginalis G3]|uniref:Dolichyl-phosphate-mannose-protein mannosyltransferase, putative n=1 Tax=Trichomonas vaginalis (strain ATCC PRA-98 / G3) TaxID=412133 RepID=A2F5C3_TRIV3|nr:dolichyl-phosphate-mannose-protein mannosyltransferase protein [Trichomonas vaginalis G3]EAX99886.1 Dolichyl-phosphate-mannose-protein mannosyltransferase, putative [Trichomonas vaginalis G3]KAI5492934.1 dolichyl-phosphate-mannose-protein mannosyltransferase protein [Trichomonas vaginalis G3]|eukprot:XP_001312816.1 Dolichyl-phosphate-mannose-protein mannosyltransferase [Trichomonas vaginalis G3]